MRSKRGEVLIRSLLLLILVVTVFTFGGCKKKSGSNDDKSDKKTEKKSDDKDDEDDEDEKDGDKSDKDKDDDGNDKDGKDTVVTKTPNVTAPAATDLPAKPVDDGKTDAGNAALAKEALAKKLNEEYGKFKEEKLEEWQYVIDNVFDPVDSYDYNKEGRAYITRLNSNYNWEVFDQAKQFYYVYVDFDGDGADELATLAKYPGVDWGTSEFTIYKYKDGNVIYMLAPETTEYIYDDTSYPVTFYNGYKYLYMMGYGIEEIDQYFVLSGDKYEKLASMPSDKGAGASFTMSKVENLANPLSAREQKMLKETLAQWLVDQAIDDRHMTSSSYNFVNDDINGDGWDELLVNDGNDIYIYSIYCGSSELIFYRDMDYEGENGIAYYPDNKVVCLYSEYNGDDGAYHYYSMNEYYYDLSNGFYDVKQLCRSQDEIQKKNSSGRYENYSSTEDYFYDGALISAQTYAKMVPRGREWQINAAYISKQKPQTGTTTSEWIFYDSDTRYISESELYGFTKDQCRFARNEIYARRGRKFDTKEVREYFESKSWYRGTINSGDFDKKVKFNDYESKNIKTIEDYEKKMGYTK